MTQQLINAFCEVVLFVQTAQFGRLAMLTAIVYLASRPIVQPLPSTVRLANGCGILGGVLYVVIMIWADGTINADHGRLQSHVVRGILAGFLISGVSAVLLAIYWILFERLHGRIYSLWHKVKNTTANSFRRWRQQRQRRRDQETWEAGASARAEEERRRELELRLDDARERQKQRLLVELQQLKEDREFDLQLEILELERNANQHLATKIKKMVSGLKAARDKQEFERRLQALENLIQDAIHNNRPKTAVEEVQQLQKQLDQLNAMECDETAKEIVQRRLQLEAQLKINRGLHQ